ncbi:MAG: hypothetical protein M3Y60_02805, partial [Bacteroidota bacterium]|nr:hypothetical protein [Bacteroidota bacterium]
LAGFRENSLAFFFHSFFSCFESCAKLSEVEKIKARQKNKTSLLFIWLKIEFLFQKRPGLSTGKPQTPCSTTP